MAEKLNVLFICSRNQWRSPTAEKVYQNDPRVEVRSAGVSASARCRVSENLLRWADRVLVMEHAHSSGCVSSSLSSCATCASTCSISQTITNS